MIIVFHNEAWCTLLRTIYSVLHTTPRILLREIILVDDKSEIEQRPEIGENLDNYIKNVFDPEFGEGFIRVLRQPTRQGLIQGNFVTSRITLHLTLGFLKLFTHRVTFIHP